MQVLRLLLEAHAETGLRDEDTGDYPLHAALSYKFWAAIPLLLQYGASWDLLDSNGDTALGIAIRIGRALYLPGVEAVGVIKRVDVSQVI